MNCLLKYKVHETGKCQNAYFSAKLESVGMSYLWFGMEGYWGQPQGPNFPSA